MLVQLRGVPRVELFYISFGALHLSDEKCNLFKGVKSTQPFAFFVTNVLDDGNQKKAPYTINGVALIRSKMSLIRSKYVDAQSNN